jgi:Uma2 family endonuclease
MAITTADQLLRATEIGRCELVRGELRLMNPAGGEHGRIVVSLTIPIGTHVRDHRLGTCYGAETGFILSRDPDTVRAPDFAFLRSTRPACPARGYYPGAPDLVVEVLSPDDRPGYVRERVAEWIEAGTLEVWVVDPQSRTIVVHEAGQPPQLLDESGVVRGRGLLPGFELAVRDIFA